MIAFATGNIWQWGPQEDLLKYVKQLGLKGVELTLARVEGLLDYKVHEEEWLKTQEHISIHAPFQLIRKAKDEKQVVEQLDKIQEIYNKIGAQNVIIHPTDLPSPALLEKYNFNVSTENLTPRWSGDLESIFSRYDVGLCLDLSHAFLHSKEESRRLMDLYGDRVTQVHLSGADGINDHLSLRGVSKDFLYSVEVLSSLDVPIVIEEDIAVKSMNYLFEEVKFILEKYK